MFDGGQITLTADYEWGRDSDTLDWYGYTTLARVEFEGIVHEYWKATNELKKSIGPRGWSNGGPCRLHNAITSSGGSWTGATQCPSPTNQTDTASAVLLFLGSPIVTLAQGTHSWCAGTNDWCYYYSGSRTVTWSIPRPALELTASDTFVVASVAKSITFTASVVPDSVWNKLIPRTVLQWRWAPDGGSEVTIGSCTMICTRSLSQSGTMYVDVRINERELTQSMRIHAEELKLVGVPDTVFPGEGITYTASTRFGSAISNGTWQWTGGFAKGDTLTAPSCVPGTTTCSVDTFEPGEMVFTGTVVGVQMSAADSGFVKDCPPLTGRPDSVLTHPSVSKRLFDALKTSNADSSANSLKREEQRLWIVRRPDTTFYVLNVTDTANSNACSNDWLRPGPNIPSGHSVVAEAHTHPNAKRDTVYGCRNAQQFPGGPGAISIKADYGGSDVDSSLARRQGFDQYVVEKDSGYIFRLNHTGSPVGNANPNRWTRTFGVCVVP